MAQKKSGSKKTAQKQPASDEAVSYDEFKVYEGQRYTGMKIGRAHTWNYDPGKWKEKKIAYRRADSDKWSVTPKTQRKRMIRFLREVIEDLERGEAEAEAGAEASRAGTAPRAKKGSGTKTGSRAKKSSGAKKGSRAKKASGAKTAARGRRRGNAGT